MSGLTLFPSSTLQLTEADLHRITQKALQTVEARRLANESAREAVGATSPSPVKPAASRPPRPQLGCNTAVAPVKATAVLVSPMDDDYKLSPVRLSWETSDKTSGANLVSQHSIDPFGSSRSFSPTPSPPRLKHSKSAIALSPTSETGSWSAWSRVGARMATRPSLDSERDGSDIPWRRSPSKPRAHTQALSPNYSKKPARSATSGSASSTSSTASPPSLVPDVSRSNSVVTEVISPSGHSISSPAPGPLLAPTATSSETWPLVAPAADKSPDDNDTKKVAEEKEPIFTAPEELSKLWELCNGQKVDLADDPIRLQIHAHDASKPSTSTSTSTYSTAPTLSRRRGKEVETPYLSLGPATQPFYTLFQSTHDPSAKAHIEIRRSNPSAKASGISVAEYSLSSITSPSTSTSTQPLPTRTDEVTTSFTPRLAILLALDAVHTLTTHPHPDDNITAYEQAVATSRQTTQAITDADARDRTTILFEPAANGYFVCHPAFGLVPVQVDGPIHLPGATTGTGCVTLWTPYTSSLPRLNPQNKRQPLASLDFTTRTLTLHPGPLRRLAALSLFAVDALIAALVAVALAEGRRAEAAKRVRVAAEETLRRAATAAAREVEAEAEEKERARMTRRLRKIKSRPALAVGGRSDVVERAASLDGVLVLEGEKRTVKRFRWWS